MSLLWYFISGYAMIDLEAVYMERVLCKVKNCGIELANVRRISYTLVTATVRWKDLGRLKKLLENEARVRLRRAGGAYGLARRLKGHIALLAGALAVLAFFLAATRFCFKVRVIGLDSISEYEVYELLKEEGAAPLKPKAGFDFKKIESALWEKYPELVFVGLRFDGNTFIAEIHESLTKPELVDAEPCSLYAARDGVIAEIVAYSGKAVVSPGESVKKGDLLIAGSYTIGGAAFSVPASGYVAAKTEYITVEAVEPDFYELRPTGKEAVVRYMAVGKSRVALSGENPFTCFIEKDKEKVRLGDNYPLCIKVRETTYLEAERVFSGEKKELAVLSAKERAYNRLKSHIEESARIYSVRTVEHPDGESYQIIMTLCTLEDISEKGALGSSVFIRE